MGFKVKNRYWGTKKIEFEILHSCDVIIEDPGVLDRVTDTPPTELTSHALRAAELGLLFRSSARAKILRSGSFGDGRWKNSENPKNF